MNSARKEAVRGFDYEKKFIRLANNNDTFSDELKRVLGISEGADLRAKEASDSTGKSDVVIYRNATKKYGLSIKTSEANFSQLERCWPEDLQERLEMPAEIREKIKDCISWKAEASRKRDFVKEEHKNDLFEYFSSVKGELFERTFTRLDDLTTHLVVCDFDKESWHVSEIEDVINLLKEGEISKTSRGGNLDFSDGLFTMQRKGGNGQHVSLSKNSLDHPGNQLQFKIKPLSIIQELLDRDVADTIEFDPFEDVEEGEG